MYTLFVNASKQHRVSFTEKNMTNQDLRHFSGLIIVENKTIHRMAILSDYFQEQHRMMAININDYKEYKIVDRLITDISNNRSVRFKVIIYFGNPVCKTHIYQPILIWEKVV